MNIDIIARIHNDFSTKFGIPRQSGLVEEITGRIVFEKPYRNPDAIRGIEGFSHIWLIWEFTGARRNDDKSREGNGNAGRSGWSATVRPPRLGGNTRMGVFATRSPFRPNPLGLSCVKLVGVENDPVYGHVLIVSGADLMDGTPIYDIKPYVPHADMRPDAVGGFADAVRNNHLTVEIPDELMSKIPENKRAALRGVLEEDPRPSYQEDPDRVYGFEFAGFEVRFRVADNVLKVCEIEKITPKA